MSKEPVPKEPKKEVYRIFLLTIWQGKDQQWRFVVEDPRTGKRQGFADVDDLIDGLWKLSTEQKASAHEGSASSPGC